MNNESDPRSRMSGKVSRLIASFSSQNVMNSAGMLYCGFAVLSMLILGIFVVVRAQSGYYANLQKAVEAKDNLRNVFSEVQDIETGQRGYLLTGNKLYLAPYEKARALIARDLRVLAPVMEISPGDHKEFAALRALVAQKLKVASSTIKLREAGKTNEAVAFVLGGSGKIIMDGIRASMQSLLVSQDDHATKEINLAAFSAELMRDGALAAFIVIVSLAYLSFSRIRRHLNVVLAGRDSLLEANRKLVVEAEQQAKLAAQLRHSQKMDALGQLTGGLAHDFNNMLAVIVSSLSIIKRRMARGETDIARYLDGAMDGAVRAASLTSRLLSFSRQQSLSPDLLDPNLMVGGLSELLSRTLGEAVHLETVLAGGVWRTNVDASQLENAILNLALNARDAMPGGGNLTIETSNAHLDDDYVKPHKDVPSGQYVLIAVTDTGGGMAPSLVEKIFDPFFTTKPAGMGTGLGLSQVYGFVKQSGGHISVYSEPGHGTTFKLYLPRGYLDELKVTAPIPTTVTPVGHVSEIILVVEDDKRVQRLTVDSLRELGYTVLHADDGEAALRKLEATPQVDLLFTDIVMPGMNGRELATEATKRQPELKVLYTSGYVPNAVVHNATLGPLEDLISKPFSIDQLARKVRQVFDLPVKKAAVVPA